MNILTFTKQYTLSIPRHTLTCLEAAERAETMKQKYYSHIIFPKLLKTLFTLLLLKLWLSLKTLFKHKRPQNNSREFSNHGVFSKIFGNLATQFFAPQEIRRYFLSTFSNGANPTDPKSFRQHSLICGLEIRGRIDGNVNGSTKAPYSVRSFLSNFTISSKRTECLSIAHNCHRVWIVRESIARCKWHPSWLLC